MSDSNTMLCFEVFTRNNGLVQYIIIYYRVFVKKKKYID
jgi:hypothetical protein